MSFKLIKNIAMIFIAVIATIPITTTADVFENEIIINLSLDDGLSNEHITSIFQDSKGYIWIGTTDGLNRFDGERIKIYNCSNNYSKSLSSTYINTISEDSCGNIWVGTDSGLDVIISDTDEIIRIKDVKSNKTNLGEIKITKLLQSTVKEGIMWVGTENGLFKINTIERKIENTYSEEHDYNVLTSSYITCLIEGKQDNILCVGTAYGINIIDYDTNEINASSEVYKENLYIYDIKKDANGNVWILTEDGIVYFGEDEEENEENSVWIINSDEFIKRNIYTGEIYEIHDNNQINVDNAEYLLGDSRGYVWLSTEKGIVRYSKENETVEILSHKDGDNYLISNEVTCFMEDKNGTVWIGTQEGVSILNRNVKFGYASGMPGEEGILNNDTIVSIQQNNNEIWVATKFKGIYIFNADTGKLITNIYDDGTMNLNNKYLKSMYKISDKCVALITNKDIMFVDTKEHVFFTYSIKNEHMWELKYVLNDEDVLWVAATDGFYSFDLKENRTIDNSDNLINNNINPRFITYIIQDINDKDIIWLGGVNIGIVKYSKSMGVIEQYKNNPEDINSLISNYITCMNFDNNGNLWIGTNIGLSKFDLNNNSFTSYTKGEGLTNNFINSILVDDNNNIWVSTNKGINRINSEDERVINFTKMDGIIGYQFCLNSSIKLSNGKMIFGSTKGITYLDPDEITDIKMNIDEVVIGDIFVGGNKVVYDGNELVLDYNNKDLYIEFFLPDYNSLNNISYEYMIEGIDTEWVYLDSKSCLDTKYLEPGKYIFKVKARDLHGDLTKETVVNLRVKNPIWKTPLAYAIYVIMLLGIIIYIVYYVKILQKLVDQKTIKLNKHLEENKRLSEEIINKEKFKNNYFVNLSHELRTPINVISSTTQLINSFNKNEHIAKDRMNKYMTIINKNCNNLLRIINDIIDTSKIETGHYKIEKKNTDIVYIVEEAALNMSGYIEEKGLSLIIDPDMEEKVISCDESEIDRCVVNLLGNAVKFTPEGGEIKVYIKENGNYVEIIVEDTGIGISEEDQEFIFERFSQVEGNGATKVSSSGIGLTLVKYIVELHNGYVKLESKENVGSKFIIGFPDIVD